MLGIRLTPEDENKLERHARERGRSKNVVAREWIIERLDREMADRQVRDAANIHGAERERLSEHTSIDATDAWLRMLDAEDGGYDWGPEGPPA